jgi:hypothetical protein
MTGSSRSTQRGDGMVIHGLRKALVTTGNVPELLTADQVSALPGVSAATLNRWPGLRETTANKSARPATPSPSGSVAGMRPKSGPGSSRCVGNDRQHSARQP